MTGKDPSFGSTGFHQLLFTIDEITAGYAYGTDNFNRSLKIPVGIQRAKAAPPQAGEQWLLTKDLGPWTFAAVMNNPITNIVESVVAGDGISVNDDDPLNPIVTNTGVYSVVAGTNVTVDDTDPHNPIVSATGGGGGGGISEIDSPLGTIHVTDSTGPTTGVDLNNPFELHSPNGYNNITGFTGNTFSGFSVEAGASNCSIQTDRFDPGYDVGETTYGSLTMSNSPAGLSQFIIGEGSPLGLLYTSVYAAIYLDTDVGNVWQNTGGDAATWTQVGAPGYLGITSGMPGVSTAPGYFMTDVDGSMWIYSTGAIWNHIT